MKRRTRHDDADGEGWTSGGDLADVEETPRSSRGEAPAVNPQPPPYNNAKDIGIRSS
jgi:hypothetical protein